MPRRKEGDASEALLASGGQDRLTAENLRVLAEDLEQCLQDVRGGSDANVLFATATEQTSQQCADVADTLSGRRGAGWMHKYESAVQMSMELLQELRVQGRRASRQDQAACEELGIVDDLPRAWTSTHSLTSVKTCQRGDINGC